MLCEWLVRNDTTTEILICLKFRNSSRGINAPTIPTLENTHNNAQKEFLKPPPETKKNCIQNSAFRKNHSCSSIPPGWPQKENNPESPSPSNLYGVLLIGRRRPHHPVNAAARIELVDPLVEPQEGAEPAHERARSAAAHERRLRGHCEATTTR